MSHQIEIETKGPVCEVAVEETVTGKHLDFFFTAFVPAVGDTMTIAREEPRAWSSEPVKVTTYEVEVLRRSWDLNDARQSHVTLIVQHADA